MTTEPPPIVDLFLKPGQYAVGDERHRLRTLLGSCVSITLWHPAHRVGAMSHFLLSCRARSAGPHHELDARYGEEAMLLMIQGLAELGVKPRQCEAKIFGGGDMFAPRLPHHPESVGRKNGEAARALLLSHGIPVKSESLFGHGHRKIIFEVATGHVWSAQVRPNHPPSRKDRGT